ncbi:MAG: hypothetical protein LPK19_02485, partial [Hymenobacteraceae bacterium]|nr:hypothetical protein [Hymenobacteraceae bacterium]MDX5395050.1 hypothetical protein [Hymenobacteraceae bacterium]MDX5511086.1 hypothetical protein [Hymenobacteraceae bacterium]
DRRQRRLPLFFTALCYAVTTYLLFRETMFDQLFFYVMGLITLSVFLTYTITIFWKISAHAVGLGGTLGILLLLNTLIPDSPLLKPILVMILIAGAVMSARLALHAHTSDEVYGGFLMGLGVGLGMWLTML